MFALRYFCVHYFNANYWQKIGFTQPSTTDISYLRTYLNDLSTAQTPTES